MIFDSFDLPKLKTISTGEKSFYNTKEVTMMGMIDLI